MVFAGFLIIAALLVAIEPAVGLRTVRSFMSMSTQQNKRVVVVGSTGYIGKFVVKESLKRGYETVAIVRPGSEPKDDFFKGAEVMCVIIQSCMMF